MTTPGAPVRFTTEQVRRRRAIALRVSVTLVVFVGLLFVVVFPLQSWLDQRSSIDESQHRLEIVREQRQKLEAEAKQLQRPSEVERIARREYGMVRPGEQAYAAVPGPSTTTTTLPQAP
ncbi:MAG: FtsB family cell division protein [Acidimicrobiia bacterium]